MTQLIALLHQACASCSRVVLWVVLMLMPLLGASCEKPFQHFDELEAYFEESKHLNSASRDSILRFSHKVETYSKTNPEASEDPLFYEIQDKIRLFLRLTDGSWGEDINITFGGNTTSGGGNSVPDSGTVTHGSIVVDTAWAGHTYVDF